MENLLIFDNLLKEVVLLCCVVSEEMIGVGIVMSKHVVTGLKAVTTVAGLITAYQVTMGNSGQDSSEKKDSKVKKTMKGELTVNSTKITVVFEHEHVVKTTAVGVEKVASAVPDLPK